MKFLVLIPILFAVGCRVNNQPNSSGIQLIEFGNAGGFANSRTSYVLDANGQLFKKENGESVLIQTINMNTLRSILDDAVPLRSYQYNAPENMYYFINIKSAEHDTSMAWTLGDNKVDQRVISLNKKLIDLLSQKQ